MPEKPRYFEQNMASPTGSGSTTDLDDIQFDTNETDDNGPVEKSLEIMASENYEINSARYSRFRIDEARVDYGELGDNHPVQVYLNKLAERIPKIDGFPLKVVLCPEWRQTNAEALPDGTVLIARGLLTGINSEEALLGVIAHEYVHIYRQHQKKILSNLKFTRDDYLKKLGMKRMNEYEADLRGTLVLLKDTDINPKGYKMFLEELQSKESTKGVVHGSSRDRVLNMADASYVFHFTSTEHELHEVPKEVLQALENVPPAKKSLREYINPPDKQVNINARIEAGQQILPEDRFIVIQRLMMKLHSRGVHSDADTEALGEQLHMFEFENFYDGINEKAKRLAMPIMLDLLCGTDSLPTIGNRGEMYPTSLSLFNDIAQTFKDELKDFRDLELLRTTIEQGLELMDERAYALGSAKDLLQKFVQIVVNTKILGDFKKGTFDETLVRQFADDWSKTFAKLSARLDSENILNAENVRSYIADYLYKTTTNESRLKLVKEFHLKPKVVANLERSETEKHAYDLGSSLINRIDSIDGAKIAEEIVKKVEKMCVGKNPVEISNIVLQLEHGMMDGQSKLFFERGEDKYAPVEDDAIAFFALNTYRTIFKKTDEYKKMNALQKKYFTFALAKKNFFTRQKAHGYATYGDEHGSKDKSDYIDEERYQALFEGAHADQDLAAGEEGRVLDMMLEDEERKIQAARHFSAEKKTVRTKVLTADYKWILRPEQLLSSDATAEDVVVLYKFLIDQKYFEEKFGADFVGLLKISTGGDVRELFAGVLYSFLGRFNLLEISDYINNWTSQGLEIVPIIHEHKKMSGPILLRIAEAVENGTLEKMPLKDVLTYSEIIADPFLKAVLQRHIADFHWHNLTFDEKLDSILPIKGQATIGDYVVRDRFIEEEVKTEEELRKLKNRIKDSTDDILSEGRLKIGIATLLDVDLRKRSPQDLVKVVHGLLTSGQNDAELKGVLYNFIRDTHGIAGQELGAELSAVEILHLADSLYRLTLSLNDVSKHLFLRKLLGSEGGLLPEPEKRKLLLEMLFKEWVKEDKNEQDVGRVLENVKQALGVLPEWELLYMAFQNSLKDHIAQAPDKNGTVPWSKIDDIAYDMSTAGVQLSKIAEKAIWDKVPSAAEQKPWEYFQNYLTYGSEQLRNALIKKGLQVNTERKGSMTPLKFVKDVGSKLSALGVRFLQNIPLVTEVSPEYADEFSEVYDRVRGQSKFAAMIHLEDQWPNMWDEVAEIGTRVGGGSIVAVYDVLLKNGDKEVVKVLNPNIRYHLEEIYKFACLVLDELVDKNGEGYEGARLLLDDIKEWIDNDINFSGFIEQDKIFRETHHGYKAANSEYSLYIPRSVGRDSKYYSREEKVNNAKNLTQWDTLVKEGHNMKDVVSTLTKNYFEQIRHGKTLSDIHPGNFAVTEDKRIAVFDRNYFLNLSPGEQEVIVAFLNPMSSVEDKISAFSTNIISKQSSVSIVECKDDVNRFAEAGTNKNWREAQRALLSLKKRGLKIPINLTLVLKNFHALQVMAKKAGFTEGLTEAFAYSV